MTLRCAFLLSVFLAAGGLPRVRSEDPPAASGQGGGEASAAPREEDGATMDPERVRAAAIRGLAVVEKAARSYPSHRSCFSCHHQTLPLLAMVTARAHGLAIDETLLREQAEFTLESFRGRREAMVEGKGVGGASMTVGYGLWALDLARVKPDETTAAMVSFLLRAQEADGFWKRSTSRPPLEDSNLTASVLAAYYAPRFAPEEERGAVTAAVENARGWLLGAVPESQEDWNSLLGGLALLRAPSERVEEARAKVLGAQREDGGWAQLPDMESDAYATGQTLFTLRRTRLAVSHPAYRKGVAFLLATQSPGGSWFVKSRSKPIQVLFDNGDPHGTDQFISIPATAWATTALALALTLDR